MDANPGTARAKGKNVPFFIPPLSITRGQVLIKLITYSLNINSSQLSENIFIILEVFAKH